MNYLREDKELIGIRLMGIVYISILPPILDMVSWVGSQKET